MLIPRLHSSCPSSGALGASISMGTHTGSEDGQYRPGAWGAAPGENSKCPEKPIKHGVGGLWDRMINIDSRNSPGRLLGGVQSWVGASTVSSMAELREHQVGGHCLPSSQGLERQTLDCE